MSGQTSSTDLKKNAPKSKRGGPRNGAGRKPGVPNKLTADVKAMILAALEAAVGVDYLLAQGSDMKSVLL